MSENNTEFDVTTLTKLSRDVKAAAAAMDSNQARYFVSLYWRIQQIRIGTGNTQIAFSKEEKPYETLSFFKDQTAMLEKQLQSTLDVYSMSHPVGAWERSICGVGPVIASSFLAHVDITKAPTAGHIERFAGLDPTIKWEKGKKRPWNDDLKVSCFYLADSFVKVSGRDNDVYGKLYRYRKALEVAKNESGANAETAKRQLTEKKYGAETVARSFYERGLLPPAHVDNRAKRWVKKIFVSHLHEVMFFHHYGIPAPRPYSYDHLGHAHIIAVPNMHMIDGLEGAIRARAPVVSIAEYIKLNEKEH
jgi:hypothetical protein